MAKSGVAMSDGSFPIPNRDYLERAVRALGRQTPNEGQTQAQRDKAVKAHIRKRAKALGAEAWLKEHTSWA